MPVEERCPERSRLSRPVVDAIAEVYRAKAAHDTAKQKRADNEHELAIALRKARDAERAAERALGEHIMEHGCER
jgi:hypothetical protein